jgi:hypothetical protein
MVQTWLNELFLLNMSHVPLFDLPPKSSWTPSCIPHRETGMLRGMIVFDLPYILTHPLLRQIYQRCAELKEEASNLPEGSDTRRALEKRIAQLEPYGLPKPDPSEQRVVQTTDDWGRVIGERSSLRRRFKPRRPGRPENCRIAVRAAIEDKIANPELTWPKLSEKFGFKESRDLERQVRLLKGLLRREGISLPPQAAYREAEEAFRRGLERATGSSPE